jgi:serine/threonine-protein kinase
MMVGATIGPYRVLDKLGEGGMGEVYRAHDTKLGRDVALKVLPEAFSQDSDPSTGSGSSRARSRDDRMVRFEREARLLASLNHPHIAAIYGLEEFAPSTGSSDSTQARSGHGGVRAIAMELVEGENLASRIARGAGSDGGRGFPSTALRAGRPGESAGAPGIPLDEALPLARQIADALEAAHEKGIIHRDLKPANVMVTPDGRVKVLDFGLAKALGYPGSEDPELHQDATEIANSPTISAIGTRAGIILGTAAYMSPEQARGKPLDRRTDVWSFGCLLYEMLTGRMAFRGETVSDTLAQILEREPDWQALPEKTPAGVRRLLRRCLQKDSRLRLRDMGDARMEIDEALPGSSSGAMEAPTTDILAEARARSVWRHPLPMGLALLAVALASALLWSLWRTPRSARAPAPVSRLSVLLPPGRQLVSDSRAIAISPDGGELVLQVEEDRGRPGPLDDMVQLYRRPMDGLTVTPIPGTEMSGAPFFSPDGEWLGLSGPGGLKKLSLRGGAPIVIPGATSGGAGTWMDDNHFIYTTRRDLFRLPADGGQAETLLTWSQLQKGEVFIGSPSAIPGTSAFLVHLEGLDPTRSALAVWSGGVFTRILTGGLMPTYLSTGHLLCLRVTRPGGNRYDANVVPFDLAQMKVTGKEIPVLEDVRFGQLAVSSTGTLAYNSRGENNTTVQLVWLDRAGSTEPIADKQVELEYSSPRVSPDGTRLLYSQGRTRADYHMFVRDLATGTTHAVGGLKAWWAAWTPDSRRVVYIQMNPEGTAGNLFWQAADGTGQADRLTTSDHHQQPLFVTPDENTLVFNEQSPGTGFDLWQLSLHGDHTPRPLLQTKANEHLAALTRDGRYMAYASDETGRDEVWVCAFPRCEGRQQVSAEGGTAPVWDRDGRTLFYRDEAATRLFTVPVTWSPAPAFGVPTVINGWWVEDAPWGRNYDITPDGKHLVMIAGTSTAGNEITVVLNWFDELKQRLTARK